MSSPSRASPVVCASGKSASQAGGPHSTPSSVINSFCLTWTAAHCSSLGFIRRSVLPHVLCGGRSWEGQCHAYRQTSYAHARTHTVYTHTHTAYMHTLCTLPPTYVHTCILRHMHAHKYTAPHTLGPGSALPPPGAEGPSGLHAVMEREPQSLALGSVSVSCWPLAAFRMFFWNRTFLDREDWCIGDPALPDPGAHALIPSSVGKQLAFVTHLFPWLVSHLITRPHCPGILGGRGESAQPLTPGNQAPKEQGALGESGRLERFSLPSVL